MLVKDPTRPVVTWYDDATGERVELSGATLDNWVAKTANLLVDGLGLGAGDRAAVLLPPHWQTAAVLLGCWAARLTVDTDRPIDVLFAAADRVHEVGELPAGDRYVLGFAPLGMPMRSVPDGFVDYVADVRGYGDRFAPYPSEWPGDDPLRRAVELGITEGDRVLVDAAAHPDPLDWLYAPLAAGASVVLCGNLDPAKVADRETAEQITVQLV
ncbi:TIGR03089 family protein [Phytohabitans aurantiacus]|uniref:TIGR03089 family protein n=1 Tax=Phytohabitans aurantiacus TaxID=3016789 RepID=A0ABQ5QNC8_9ACTN|nr:TIGR03089 family protein [Phytohabitans aurantiacus]GLH95928.1 TIGR03089 family protein [Phytohabitans aurantiacus]